MSIKNETQHDLTISLWQVGPLYYENVVKPGETFSRSTGAVHFTVKAWLHTPENELDDWSVAKPIIFTTVGSVIGAAAAIPTAGASLAFAEGVAAIPAGLSAMALGTTTAGATMAGTVFSCTVMGAGYLAGATVIGGGALLGSVTVGSIGGKLLGMAGKYERTDLVDAIIDLMKTYGEPISSAGWYAGYDHKLKIVGGPRKELVKTESGDIIPILVKEGSSPMTLVEL